MINLNLHESKRASIESHFEEDIHKAIIDEIYKDEKASLIKGKALPVGTEKKRGNVTYIKTAQGWEVKKSSKSPKKEDESKGKSAKKEDPKSQKGSSKDDNAKKQPTDHNHEAKKAALGEKIHRARAAYEDAKAKGDQAGMKKHAAALDGMKGEWEAAKAGPSKDSSAGSEEKKPVRKRKPTKGTKKDLSQAMKKRASNPQSVDAYNNLQNALANRLTKQGIDDAGVASKAAEKMMQMPEIASGQSPLFTDMVIEQMTSDYKGEQRKKVQQVSRELMGSEEGLLHDVTKGSKAEAYLAINEAYGTNFKRGDIDELEDESMRSELTKEDIDAIVEDEKENQK